MSEETSRTFEIHFPPKGEVHMLAVGTICTLAQHLPFGGFGVKMFQHVDGKLTDVDPRSARADTTYVYQVDIDPLPERVWKRFRRSVIDPLLHEGVEIRGLAAT